mmetsp:Transcript_33662/g.79876  ORF Transcript_33662/g.79876 Transcript_33662/m.79876 type:complete len:264 (-) Transcript_33662:699-1490(-)
MRRTSARPSLSSGATSRSTACFSAARSEMVPLGSSTLQQLSMTTLTYLFLSGCTSAAKLSRAAYRLAISAAGISARVEATLWVAAQRLPKASTSSKACFTSLFPLAYRARRFISPLMITCTLTPDCSSGHAPSRTLNVRTWNSSGNAWIMQSIRYCWAMSSLQDTTCSMILGRTWPSYMARSIPSSWLSRTRFFPTRSCSCCRSFSLRSFSCMAPWCCIRTHSLFISVKLRTTKSMASLTLPPSGPSYGDPVSGSLSRETCAR